MSDQSEAAYLAVELRTVLFRLIKKLRSQSPTHGKMSLTERSVLKLLDQHQQLLPTELAAMEKVTTQAMSQILKHLAELGYITRQPSGIDKRKVGVALSEQGRALLQDVRLEVDEWLHVALQEACSPQERASLHQAMPILTKLVDL
ncbi:MarR family winged helix-turn-helix transcriptional regulator [Hymenobacter sp. GOD-10R]|uniref:MarR family winged helix-turn-helix transcriptional regulator n=1 Tax=Hymenobacter sp. GOD-10R TaxID=3093922 RepID=UPI002D76E0A4|nr:MarR family transcriptional regulator [Hymenobacter sp. GOD-10R]WRQ29516.1 MarR family transcriptional regulator [Hymenobacter sp. GOD-10R]